ncbi:MAG: hypothetical protein KDA84_21200, partial [Planctomycetaceae bacterium]|nr:hypothetical protein [Planctomycetaceae bacterium]
QGPFFDTLLKILPTISMEPPQVRFLSNYCDIYENGVAKTYRTTELVSTPARFAEGLKLRFENGEILMPESLENNSAHNSFVPAFRSYMEDGGITAFKEVIRTKIASSVREATCREVRTLSVGLIDDLMDCLKNAQEGGLDEENCDLASDWSFVFLEVEDRLAPGKMRADLSRIAHPLFEGLWGILLPNIHEKTVDLVRDAERKPGEEDQWVSLHKNVTERMSRSCQHAISEVIREYALQVENLLQQAGQRRNSLWTNGKPEGELKVPRGFHPVQRFRNQVHEEVMNQDFFKADLDILMAPVPLVKPMNPTERSEITTAEYLVVMRRKVETFCYRILSKIRILLARECQRIQRQLTLRSRVRQGPDVIDAERLAAALKCLEDAKKQIDNWHRDDFVGVSE